ncbi:hypothetical protein ACLQ3H_16060 [Micromonospora saelicesensis]|uniref:hypothetical protein n=1 Tax=Micromonospora saelicesensis TaxID=285676 RepID=UPI003CF4F8AD
MDNVSNRFFVLEGTDIPAEVRAELEAYQLDVAVTSSAQTRGLVEDSVLSVLGGLVSAGIWDQLPLWASWWSGFGSAFQRANAGEVTTSVAKLCVQAGLASKEEEVTVQQLAQVAQQGWTGRASVGTTVISFRTDRRGQIVLFDAILTGAATA